MGDPQNGLWKIPSTPMDDWGYPHDLGQPPRKPPVKQRKPVRENSEVVLVYPDIWFLRPTSWARVQVSAFTAAPREIRSSRSDFCSASRVKKNGMSQGKTWNAKGKHMEKHGKTNWKTMEKIWTHMNNLSIRNWDFVEISHNFGPYLSIVNNMYSL